MRKRMVALLAGAMLMMGMATAASALEIKFSEIGFSDAVILDTNFDGQINLNGFTFGDFSIVFVGGSSSLPSDATKNKLSINSFAVTNLSNVNKTLNVVVTDNGYQLNPVYPGSPNTVATFGASGLGFGQNPTTASFNAYIDTNNALYAQTAQIGTWGPLPLTGASTTVYTPTTLTNSLFSLTETIEANVGGLSFANFNSNVEVAPVPEPGTMMLLGIGMLGMAIYGKRRMNKEA